MSISDADWQAFLGHLNATLATFEVPAAERTEVLAFIDSTKSDIIEV
jgi:hemoglobin